MKVVLSHDSAFEFWMNLDVRLSKAWQQTKADVLANTVAPPRQNIDDLLGYRRANSNRPVHILLGNQNGKRRGIDGVATHVLMATPPPGSFCKITKDLFVCSPALCLAQLGNTLEYGNLLKAAYWLCGIFAFAPATLKMERCLQVATISGIRRYLERASGIRGSKQALVACRYALDRCASPRESDLASFVFATRLRGGRGLPLGCLNYAEDIPEAMQRTAQKSSFECDIFWPRERVALEYDSDEYHSGEMGHARDSRKDAALKLAGVKVHHVTNRQIRDPLALDAVIAGVRKDLKLPKPRDNPKDFARTSNLRQQLLGKKKWDGFSLYDRHDFWPHSPNP